jgi:hypothetical protein
LYNYADDNTLSYVNDNYEKLIDILEKESSVLIDWFKFNCMQANPDKFQVIAVGNNWFPKLTKLPRGAVLAVCFPDKMAEGISLDENENINFDGLQCGQCEIQFQILY